DEGSGDVRAREQCMQLLRVPGTGRCGAAGTLLARAEAGAVIGADAGVGGDGLPDAGRTTERGGRCSTSLPGFEGDGRAAASAAFDVQAVAADVHSLPGECRLRGRRPRGRRRGRALHTRQPTRVTVELVAVVLLVETALTGLSCFQAPVLPGD